MTELLENIAKAGKKIGKLNQLEQQFRENPGFNLAHEVARLRGAADADAQLLASATPAQQYMAYQEAQGALQNEVVMNVRDSYKDVIEKLASGEDAAEGVAALLIDIKPVEYKNMPQAVFDAHKKAQKVVQAAQNPAKMFGESLTKMAEKAPEIAVLSRTLAQRSQGYIEQFAQQRVAKAVGELSAALGKDAKEYLTSLYEKADENAQVNIAYKLGMAYTSQA